MATVQIRLSEQSHFQGKGEILRADGVYQLIDRRSRDVLAQFPVAAMDSVVCPQSGDVGPALIVLNPERV